MLFNGKQAHEALPFTGVRYSFVAFTCPRFDAIDPADKARAAQSDFVLPEAGSISNLWNLLALGPSKYADMQRTIQSNRSNALKRRSQRCSSIQQCQNFCNNCSIARCTCHQKQLPLCDAQCNRCRLYSLR